MKYYIDKNKDYITIKEKDSDEVKAKWDTKYYSPLEIMTQAKQICNRCNMNEEEIIKDDILYILDTIGLDDGDTEIDIINSNEAIVSIKESILTKTKNKYKVTVIKINEK